VITIKHFLFLLVCSYLIFISCKNDYRNSTHKDIPISSIEKGKVLAVKYCQSCHLLPDPSLLDTKSWEKGVLPSMGPRLGIFHYDFDTYPSYRSDKNIDPNFYPAKPVLSFVEWQNILDYYIATSPDSLPKQIRKKSIQPDIPFFSVQYPKFTYDDPSTSFVKIRANDSLHSLVIGDVFKQNIYFLNQQLQVKDSVYCGGPIVDMDFMQNKILACNIGILNPNNGRSGSVQFINIDQKGEMEKKSNTLFDSLRRPVELTSADMNNDNRTDYVVCEFGNLIGALSWFENLGDDKFQRHVLRAYPGAIKAYVNDYNNDGKQDLWVLFSQGEEGIFLFTNKGNGIFESQEILRFPPVYGSSYFELTDFNKDGFPDIIYTCGDNADYSVVFKPYHGVYIFLNDKANHFNQKYFFPINGCYKAIPRDFDNDGDIDLATISFFADYNHQPEEGFVYLKNEGNFNFIPYSLLQTQSGRWLTMDAGDINGDGKIDIVLGNFTMGPSILKSKMDLGHTPPFIVLKNIGK